MARTVGLTRRFGSFTAVDAVSLDVGPGEIVGLIGANGAGKTTLIRMLLGLLRPSEGTVELFGTAPSRRQRRKLGYVSQGLGLYQDLTVEENLQFFATIFGTTIEENYDLIKDIYIQIEPFKTRRAGKLSGGMKQKLALSCALIHKPEVLFLDEPTTGVDPVSRKEFWEMLKRLQQKGISILVSTPYMDEAELCDRVALIQNGRILEIDTPERIVKKHPKKLFNVKASNMYQLIHSLNNYEYAHSVYPFGEFVHYIDKRPDFDPEELRGYLKSNELKEVVIGAGSPTIEDVFMELAR
ncbi:MAG: ABC transporter ATP-binding protein [Flavobacteriaceae bacterium]|nr:ABC transporter ATP-binding protein [Flavobacteriaceae bacterium]